mmetsp:Transcript_2730/g.9936  ORF Transcript_2730/g.9936 Transcript_2730/m.9936 type:complete len:931 (-) Transcript_2730:195-2987(-)
MSLFGNSRPPYEPMVRGEPETHLLTEDESSLSANGNSHLGSNGTSAAGESGGHKLVRRYVLLLERVKYGILIGSGVIIVVGAILSVLFLKNTSLSFEAPDGSPSYKAQEAIEDEFDAKSTQTIICYITAEDGGVLDLVASEDTPLKVFSEEFNRTIETSDHVNALATFPLYYYALNDAGYVMEAHSFVSADQTSSIVAVVMDADSDDFKGLKKDMKKFVDDYSHDEIDPVLTGKTIFGDDTVEGVAHDLETIDFGLSLPLALIVLSCFLVSVRLLLIPVLCVLVSATASFGLMYPVSEALTVISFAPSIMMSCLIAMSIDYSLFLLSRYREEIDGGATPFDAVVTMVSSAGHTVLASGSTLSLCFLGLCFFPMDLLRSIGLGCALAIAGCVVTSLTVTPSMLLTLPGFFSKSDEWLRKALDFVFNCKCMRKESGTDYKGLSGAIDGTDEEEQHLTNGNGDAVEENKDAQLITEAQKSCYYRFGHKLVKYNRWIGATMTLCLALPFGIMLKDFEQSASLTLVTPRNADSEKAFEALGEDFGAGTLFPYTLLSTIPDKSANNFDNCAGIPISQPCANADDTQALWDEVVNAVEAVQFDDAVESISSVLYTRASGTDVVTSYNEVRTNLWTALGGGCIDTTGVSNEVNFFGCPSRGPTCDETVCSTFFNLQTGLNEQATALKVTLYLSMDPFDPDGRQWLDDARSALDDLGDKSKTGMQFYLANGAGSFIDEISQVYDLLPVMIVVTLLVVFILNAINFRSGAIPARAVFTISVMLLAVYGASVIVYVKDGLGWLGIPGLEKAGEGALCWVTPVMSFSILVGLGLDYDIFLLTRIVEFRQEGHSNNDSIILALAMTGPVIAAAGLIMAIAFAGLLFSGLMVLNQLSFYLVFGVVLDTFCMSTIIVPCIMVELGERNWWPTKMPAVTKAKIPGV